MCSVNQHHPPAGEIRLPRISPLRVLWLLLVTPARLFCVSPFASEASSFLQSVRPPSTKVQWIWGWAKREMREPARRDGGGGVAPPAWWCAENDSRNKLNWAEIEYFPSFQVICNFYCKIPFSAVYSFRTRYSSCWRIFIIQSAVFSVAVIAAIPSPGQGEVHCNVFAASASLPCSGDWLPWSASAGRRLHLSLGISGKVKFICPPRVARWYLFAPCCSVDDFWQVPHPSPCLGDMSKLRVITEPEG